MSELKPLPCYLCGELPKVGAIQLMTGKVVWTCLCPNHHYETNAYYNREGAIDEWNRWVESEGWPEEDEDDEDGDIDEWDFWEWQNG